MPDDSYAGKLLPHAARLFGGDVSDAWTAPVEPQEVGKLLASLDRAKPEPTIGASRQGERYVPPSFNEMMAMDNPLKGVAEHVLGAARPPSVYAQDPTGVDTWLKDPSTQQPPLVSGTTEEVGDAALRGIRAFHGSAADFDKFDIRHIGTGQGANSYGRGLYFAQAEPVALDMRNQLAPKPPVVVGDQTFHPELATVDDILSGHRDADEIVRSRIATKVRNQRAIGRPLPVKTALDHIEAELEQGIHLAVERGDEKLFNSLSDQRLSLARMREAGIDVPQTGHMYEVNLKVDPSELLDWDKRLGQQSPQVQDAVLPHLRALADHTRGAREELLQRGTDSFGRPLRPERLARLQQLAAPLEQRSGADVYRLMGFHPGDAPLDEEAGYLRSSEALKELGIPGSQYLDQHSRLPQDTGPLEARLDDLRSVQKVFPGPEVAQKIADTEAAITALRNKPPTRNYVMFDDSLIDILRKYGMAPPLAAGLMAPKQSAQPPLAPRDAAISADPGGDLPAMIRGEAPIPPTSEPHIRASTPLERLTDSWRDLMQRIANFPLFQVTEKMGLTNIGDQTQYTDPNARYKVLAGDAPLPGAAGAGTLTEEAAAEHLSRAPVEHVGERLLVSPRILGTKGRNFVPAEPGRILTPTVEAAMEDPEYFTKLAAEARKSPMLKPREARLSDKGVVSAFADRGAENIDALFEMAPPGVRTRAGRWYPGGQGIGDTIAKDAGLPVNAGAGAIARLSPGTDWDMNISNAQRLGRWWKAFTEADQPFTRQHFNRYVDTRRAQAEEWIHANQLTGPKLAKYQAQVANKIAEVRGYIDHPWSELPYEQRAQLVRAHSELAEPQTFARYAPEGHVVIPEARGVNGEPLTMKWQSYDNLGRVLAMFDDPSDASISTLLGKGHKIRSFFNNLSVPTDPRSLTADVHNVAGTNLRPLGGSASEVLAVQRNIPGSAQTGIEGTYPLYQAATERAAAARGILPNKAQSIPWETTRGLFSPAQRRDEALRAMAEQIWNDYQRGTISLDGAQLRLHDLAGGVTPPAWTHYPAKPAQ